jgi:hypothetical protein
VSNWAYVAIAYTAVWGALAIYGLLLARRVTGARDVENTLQHALDSRSEEVDNAVVCDTPPVP